MARRRPGLAPIVSFTYEEPKYENGRNRAVIKPDVEIPGNTPDLNGGWRPWDSEKDDTTLTGHPEAAGQYEVEYDRNDPFLGGKEVIRRDLNYVSPEEIRRKSKQRY
jgi:hypothetical protein